MDIILDTNSLYYYSRLSENENVDLIKLINKIHESDNVYISSVTIYEAVNYLKKHAAYFRRLITFIKIHHIQILQQNLLPANDVDIKSMSQINQNDLELLYRKLITRKIKVETDYSVVILNLLIVTYLYFYITDQNPMPLDKFSMFFYHMASILIKVNRNVFKELYSTGYNTKDCDKYIKNAFYALLEFNLQEYAPFLQPLCTATSAQEFDDVINKYDYNSINEASKKIENRIRKRSTTTKYLQNYMKLYEKNKEKGLFDSFFQQFILPNTKQIPSKALQLFINESVEKMIKSGCAFHKNDITDRLIIDQITDNRDIITFDAGIMDFLKRNIDLDSNYLRSFDLSISLLK